MKSPAKQTWRICLIKHTFVILQYLKSLTLLEVGSEVDHASINLEMLQNVVKVLDKTSSKLKHISVMQGTKAYGGHLGPFKMPARETDPRSMGPKFLL